MEQLAPEARVAPQAFAPVVIAKSSKFTPPMLGTMLVRATVPVLESVAAIAIEVARSTVIGKLTKEVNEAAGVPMDIELLVVAASPVAAAERV
jgi:hypothetical protein